MFDKPKDQLQALQQELLELEPVDESEAVYLDEKHFYSPNSDAEKNIRRKLEKENREPRRGRKQKEKKKKKHSFLTFLVIVLEIALIVILLRWWSQWLT